MQSSGTFTRFRTISNIFANLTPHRDSEESAPAEYPPDQPEADNLDDDSGAYGVEETELEAALERELAEAEKQPKGEDHEMEGAEPAAGKDEDEEDISDGESEDIEDESDDDDDELDEEDGNDGDEDVEMGDDSEQKDEPANGKPAAQQTHQSEVMVH